jgi:hypothetical protein
LFRYETSDLKNADVITETAKNSFLAGEINYLEFVILVNQAVRLKIIIPMQSGNLTKVLLNWNTLL